MTEANASGIAREVKGFVYLVQADTNNAFKVGIAINTAKRLSGLQTGSPVRLTMVDNWASKTPLMVEKLIHDKLRDFKIHGEWFSSESLPLLYDTVRGLLDSGDLIDGPVTVVPMLFEEAQELLCSVWFCLGFVVQWQRIPYKQDLITEFTYKDGMTRGVIGPKSLWRYPKLHTASKILLANVERLFEKTSQDHGGRAVAKCGCLLHDEPQLVGSRLKALKRVGL